MKGCYHLKFTQYFKILTLNRGEWGIFLKIRGPLKAENLCIDNKHALSFLKDKRYLCDIFKTNLRYQVVIGYYCKVKK